MEYLIGNMRIVLFEMKLIDMFRPTIFVSQKNSVSNMVMTIGSTTIQILRGVSLMLNKILDCCEKHVVD